MPTDKDNNPSMDDESKCKEVVFTINSYEDTRNGNNKQVSYDPSDYIQKARVTRAAPPKPAYDPLQFVQLRPCNLVKSAQEQMKKAETAVKKVQEEKKEEPEEWQCNLDNWKSSRRKRVEHIIDRVVEVKKLELEEHDRNRRKSKTFNEMMEERGARRKYLPIYADSDDNDLSDLGLGNSDCPSAIASTADDASLHEDATKADLSEYTYEGAIESYKSRISKTAHLLSDNTNQKDPNEVQIPQSSTYQNDGQSDCATVEAAADENKSFDTSLSGASKIDFFRRKELFEKEQTTTSVESESRRQSTDFISTVSIKERLSVLQLNGAQIPNEMDKNQKTLPDVSFMDLKNRLEVFEREIRNVSNEKVCNTKPATFTLHEGSVEPPNVTQHNVMSIVKAIDRTKPEEKTLDKVPTITNVYGDVLRRKPMNELDENENIDTDREDSGIHTTDVSCSVSQADDQTEEAENHMEDGQNSNTDDDFSKENNYETKPLTTNVVPFESHGDTYAECEDANDVSILDDALEMAFQEIDNMQPATEQQSSNQAILLNEPEPIYQNIENDFPLVAIANRETKEEIEPYYQVPKSQEPYYEVPKTKPVPLYENVDILQSVAVISEKNVGNTEAVHFTIGIHKLQPPKEKPPPPPVEDMHNIVDPNELASESNKEAFKRINSTKRIKKEIRNKRSNFLGIENTSTEEDGMMMDFSLVASKAPTMLQQEERKLERQLLMKTGLYDSSDAAESRDSGVSENHSRQSSDLFTPSSDDPEELIKPKVGEERKFHFNEYNDQTYRNDCFQQDDDEFRYQQMKDHLRESEDSTRVLAYESDQGKELKNSIPPPVPPAKPMRSPQYLQNHYHNLYSEHRKSLSNVSNLDYAPLLSKSVSLSENQIAYHNACNNISTLTEEFLPRSDQTLFCNNPHAINSNLEMQDNIPLLKPVNDWDQQHQTAYQSNEFLPDAVNPLQQYNLLRQRSYTECAPQWNVNRSTNNRQTTHHQSSDSSSSYSRHWFVQEAEQRRIEQQHANNAHHSPGGSTQNKNANRKSLPESVIQTITQRVQKLGIGTDRRWHSEGPYQSRPGANESGINSKSIGSQIHHHPAENDEKVLSVSGKKKCSHCNNELGRGAAMVIESLGLLYHINCFKCCVCHIKLGDGLKGTDVRVRKYKLHCQNCFSSEDGVKFSCV